MCDINEKTCTVCGVIKPMTKEFFHKKLNNFHSHCKECRKSSSNEFYLKNKIALNQKTKDYYIEHRGKLLSYAKKYRSQNIEKLQTYEKTRYKSKSERRKILGQKDGSTKIIHNIRVCINRCIKDIQKTSNSTKYLGCSIEEFKQYLESKFNNGMSWSNYGRPNKKNSDGWHIDHIKPLASFDFENIKDQDELENKLHLAWHYTNLQPLWGLDNIRKGSKSENNFE